MEKSYEGGEESIMPDFEQGEVQVAVMLRRLSYATGSGKRLEGVKINPATDEKTEYQKRDLPCINIISWEESEEPFEGGTGDIVLVNGTITFGLHIHQRNLLVDFDGTSSRNPAIYYLSRIRDVIETDYDASIDLTLEDTCRTGIEIVCTEARMEGGAAHHSFEVEVTYKPHLITRGTRTDTLALRDIGTSA